MTSHFAAHSKRGVAELLADIAPASNLTQRITMQEFAVLLFVFAHCSGAAEVGISILGLMRQSGWKVATVSKLVSTLEANGYVSSAPNPKDLRSRLVSITTKGERLARSGRNPPWGGLKNTPDKDQT